MMARLLILCLVAIPVVGLAQTATEIVTEPPGITVTVCLPDGTELGEGKTPFPVPLPKDAEEVVFERNGWADAVVRKSKGTFRYQFGNGSFALTANRYPVTWSIHEISRKTWGPARQVKTASAAVTISARSGHYQIIATDEFGQEFVQTVQLEADEEKSITATFQYGKLSVTTPLPGAQVFAWGQLLGKTPLSLDSVPTGEWRLEIRHENLRPSSRTIQVKADEVTKLDLEIEQLDYDRYVNKAKSEMSQMTLGAKYIQGMNGVVYNSTPIFPYEKREKSSESQIEAWERTKLLESTRRSMNSALESVELERGRIESVIDVVNRKEKYARRRFMAKIARAGALNETLRKAGTNYDADLLIELIHEACHWRRWDIAEQIVKRTQPGVDRSRALLTLATNLASASPPLSPDYLVRPKSWIFPSALAENRPRIASYLKEAKTQIAYIDKHVELYAMPNRLMSAIPFAKSESVAETRRRYHWCIYITAQRLGFRFLGEIPQSDPAKDPGHLLRVYAEAAHGNLEEALTLAEGFENSAMRFNGRVAAIAGMICEPYPPTREAEERGKKLASIGLYSQSVLKKEFPTTWQSILPAARQEAEFIDNYFGIAGIASYGMANDRLSYANPSRFRSFDEKANTNTDSIEMAYDALIELEMMLGRESEARLLLQRIKSCGNPKAYQSAVRWLANWYVNQGKLDEASTLLSTIEDNEKELVKLAAHHYRKGNRDLAFHAYDMGVAKMKKKKEKLSGSSREFGSYDSHQLRDLPFAIIDAGEEGDLVRALRDLKGSGGELFPDLARQIGERWIAHGKVDTALGSVNYLGDNDLDRARVIWMRIQYQVLNNDLEGAEASLSLLKRNAHRFSGYIALLRGLTLPVETRRQFAVN